LAEVGDFIKQSTELQKRETAQDKYKQQIDKRSKDPEFRLDQRVWYYNPKIPKDKSAKLHLKWTGPYYITDFGLTSVGRNIDIAIWSTGIWKILISVIWIFIWF
jgi:hypothetical protein